MHMIEEPMSHTDQEFHRKVAPECFDRTWDYLEQQNRSLDDDQMMLNLAHASRYHRSLIGKPGTLQLATGRSLGSTLHWTNRISRSALQGKPLEISQKDNLSERLISAYEGMARTHAAAREYPFAGEFVSKAREQLRAVSLDDEDRKTYSDQIDETERMIPK
jgi:hypothetical protein